MYKVKHILRYLNIGLGWSDRYSVVQTPPSRPAWTSVTGGVAFHRKDSEVLCITFLTSKLGIGFQVVGFVQGKLSLLTPDGC